MIFKTAKELAQITGSYYANSNFDKVLPFLIQAYNNLSSLIGADTIKKADDAYGNIAATDSDKLLLQKVQIPVAIMGTLQLYRHNDISHEDNGRKVKIDTEHEKIPWEWQLSRDDEMMLNDYYASVDVLLEYLESSKESEWLVQKSRIGLKSILLGNSEEFSRYWSVSPRVFIQLVPLMKEAQRRWLIPALGGQEEFDAILTAKQGGQELAVFPYAANALVLFTMYLSFHRGLYSIIPQGVIQKNLQSSGMYKGESISYGSVVKYAESLMREAKIVLDDMKVVKQGTQTYELLPENDKHNKYMIL